VDPLVAIAVACLAVAQLHARVGRDRGWPLEAVVLAGATTLAWLGVISIALGLLGWFRPVFVAEACFVVAVVAVSRRPRPASSAETQTATPFGGAVWLLLVLAVGAWLRTPPMPAPLAGHDQSTYRLRAEAQALQHSIEIHDPLLESMFRVPSDEGIVEDVIAAYRGPDDPKMEGWYEAPYRPGFYLRDAVLGRITPQFFHLHPAVLAVFELADSERGIRFATWLEGMLALLAFTAVARRLLGPRWSVLAVALVAFSPVAVWTHRNPLTEGMMGVFLWSAMLAWLRAEARAPSRTPDETERPVDAHLGAWLLGLATWIRGDAWVWGPLVALAAVLFARRPGHDRSPAIFALCLGVGGAVHAWTSYPYVHDEIARRLPAAWASPEVLAGGWLSLAIAGLLADVVGRRARRGSSRRGDKRPDHRIVARVLPLGLGLAALALITWWIQDTGHRPFSRLDAAPGALGLPFGLAAVAGGLVLAGSKSSVRGRMLWLLPIPLVTLWLFVPRSLPAVGLYYYGRYLVPVLLPCAAILATLVVKWIRGPDSGARSRHRVAAAVGLGLVASNSHVLARSVRTHMVEFDEAARVVEHLAAGIPRRAAMISGGEGWHAGFTFNQIGGALAMRHRVSVVPYRNREAAHAAALAMTPLPARPVYLLVNEASHHYTREDGTVVAGSDELLSAPLVATHIRHVELYTHLLTPDTDRAPVRVTRQALRASMIRLIRDDSTLHVFDLSTEQTAEAAGAPTRGLSHAGGGVCLDPRQPLRIPVRAALRESDVVDRDGPVEITIRGTRGSYAQTPRLKLFADGKRLVTASPGDERRARHTLGPILLPRAPEMLEIRGADAQASSVCLHGGVSEVWVAPPPRTASSMVPDENITATAFAAEDDFGMPYKFSHWAPGRALTRFRPGTRGMQVHALSMRMTRKRPLSFALAAIPAADAHDVIVTMTGSRLSPEARVELRIDGTVVERFDPPDRIRGSWQGPKTRLEGLPPAVSVELKLVGADAEDRLDVRDVAFFSVVDPRASTVVRTP
jgi:hypothetical protein